MGDITSKSDTGSYTYGSGAGPHAVTSISGPAGGSYGYDADGNMVNRNGTTIAWNSLNLPTQITQSGSNSSSFAYAPDKHRYYQSAVINGVTETTVYVGAFEAVTTGGVTTYRYHLSADSREVAEVDLSNSGSSVTEKINYILSDHLGSTDVVETTDVNGNVLSTTGMSFSAWGGWREPNTWLPPVGSSETQADHNADRYGFTHQEMLDNVGIVHMNGRIYDPNLGRFLSVDPVFEFPTNTQSLNPYSYVLNNPLSMTDPTGYVADSCNAGQTTCSISVSVSITKNTTSTDLGSHIAVHGQTTITTTKEANGNTVQTASGNGFGLGETAEVSVDRGGGNGAQMTQSVTSAQTQPTTHTDIGSPAQTGQAGKSNDNLDRWEGKKGYGHINPEPDGPNGPKITFRNDDPGGPNTDHAVKDTLKAAIEGAVRKTGISVNINSTTGGDRTSNDPHYQGRAADINRLNGMRVGDPYARPLIVKFESALLGYKAVNEILSPVLDIDIAPNRVTTITNQRLIEHHLTHIHVNVGPLP